MPDPKNLIKTVSIPDGKDGWLDYPYVPGMKVKSAFKNIPTRKPIYTSNPNDPRIKSYQDSLTTYNLGPEFNNKILEFWNKKKSSWEKKSEFFNSTLKEFRKKGFKPDLGYTWPNYHGYNNIVLDDYKKPVQPVLYKKPAEVERPKVDKAVVKPKNAELSVKKKELKTQKSLPKSVTGFKMDASGANVYLSVKGKQTVMPKKEFTSWLQNPENRAMYDKYRSSQAKTLKKK